MVPGGGERNLGCKRKDFFVNKAAVTRGRLRARFG
jgi:hypothetical protein